MPNTITHRIASVRSGIERSAVSTASNGRVPGSRRPAAMPSGRLTQKAMNIAPSVRPMVSRTSGINASRYEGVKTGGKNDASRERKNVGEGKRGSVSGRLGGTRYIKKKIKK